MARLIIRIEGAPEKVLELRPGPHRVGRAPESDILLPHPSVSSQHCLLELCDDGLLVRDLGSTNGTYLDDQLIMEAVAQSGQILRIGAFHCLVEGVIPRITIPTWGQPPPELPPGVKPCFNHPEFPASMQCTRCHRVFCGSCVHLMQRRGGRLYKLCPVCSNPCLPLDDMNKADEGNKLLNLLKKMVPNTGSRRGRRGRRGARRFR